MPSSFRRPLFALTAATGGLLAALSSSAVASADEWAIGAGDAPAQIISEAGMPPLYQDVLEQGTFSVVDRGPVEIDELYASGLLSSTNMFGMSNEDFVVSSSTDSTVLPAHSVIDVTTAGNFENIYADLAGAGPNGANEITDTLVTPFGNVNIPTTFDAAAFGSVSLPAAAAESAAASDVTAYTITPEFDDAITQLTSVGGIEPFYQTADYSGGFLVNGGLEIGNADYYSDMFGMHNVLFQSEYNNTLTQIIDDLNLGHGYDMVYTDILGATPDSPNTITDTLVTPFGDINIPTTFDAIAEFPTTQISTAAESVPGFLGAFDADWTTLVTDFSALF